MKNKLDKKDMKIIEVLKGNSRLSIREIAKKTNIRPSTVHQRILKLKQQKVIEKFTIKLDNKSVDENFIVFMLVKTKPTTIFGSKIINNPQIKEIFGVTGDYDLIFKLKFKDVVDFNDFVIKFRKDNPIESTSTMVVTTDVKEEI